jgi:hypothetical protein
MSKEALAKVVQRAISDAGFRRQLNSDPTGALRGFDLSADELSALRTGNAGRLSSLGIDQRMSKAFVIGGAVGATRMAQSDLSAGSSNVIDDTSGMGSRTVIPNDPDRVITADVDAGPGGGIKGTVRAGDDYKFASRTAPEGTAGSARVGDDWKFASSADASGGEASRSAINDDPDGFLAANADASGGGMANYPAHGGLAGPSSVGSARAGDDWKFADRAQGSVAPVEGSPEATAADIAAGGGSSAARSINDDPDGFLAANANADTSGGASGGATSLAEDSENYLSAVGYDSSTVAHADASGSAARASAINDDPDGFLAANANADLSGSRGDGTAFLDESEAYLAKVGYDESAATSAVTDAHDRGGDNIVTRIDDGASDSSNASAASEQEPNISS